MQPTDSKNEYAKAVSLFLAEMLRTRKINLTRAADIAEKVVSNINLIDTEQDFLKLVKDLSGDFEELVQLHDLTRFRIHVDQRRELETKVRQFVVLTVSSDMPLAVAILQEAIRDELQLDDLCRKFPKFKQFIEKP